MDNYLRVYSAHSHYHQSLHITTLCVLMQIKSSNKMGPVTLYTKVIITGFSWGKHRITPFLSFLPLNRVFNWRVRLCRQIGHKTEELNVHFLKKQNVWNFSLEMSHNTQFHLKTFCYLCKLTHCLRWNIISHHQTVTEHEQKVHAQLCTGSFSFHLVSFSSSIFSHLIDPLNLF